MGMTFETIRLRVGHVTGMAQLSEHPAMRAALVGKSRRLEKQAFCFDTPELLLWRQGVILCAERLGNKWQAVLTGEVEHTGLSQVWECGSEEHPDWSELKRFLAAWSVEEVKPKQLRPCLLVHRKEERWRLEYPDGARIWVHELRGQMEWLGEEGLTEPFHEWTLELSAGPVGRFLQSALALARHGSATLEPLSPEARGLVRLDASPLTPGQWTAVPWSSGERMIGALARTGAMRIQGMQELLVGLLYGSEGSGIAALIHLDRAVTGLRRLIGWFGEWLPEPMRRDLESELLWLSGELRSGIGGVHLRQQTLPRMRNRFPEISLLTEALERARQDGVLTLKQARQAVVSWRFTRLWIGLAIWMGSEEGIKGALKESEEGVRSRLALGVEEQTRELLRQLIKPLNDWCRRGAKAVTSPEDVSGVLLLAEALEEALGLCGTCWEERNPPALRQGLQALVRAGRIVVELEEEQQLWQRLATDWSGQPVTALFRGWQGARQEAAWDEWYRAWDAFQAAPFPWNLGREPG